MDNGQGRGAVVLTLTLLFCPGLAGCGDPAGEAYQELASLKGFARHEIRYVSDQVDESIGRLEGLAKTTTGQSRDAVMEAVQELGRVQTDVVRLAGDEAASTIATAGAETRCDTKYFVETGIEQQVERIRWRLCTAAGLRRPCGPKPVPSMQVCHVMPSSLTLYRRDDGWATTASAPGVTAVLSLMGYNFSRDDMPRIELRGKAADGQPVTSQLSLSPVYTTQFQVQVDLAELSLPDPLPSEATLRVVWPGGAEENSVILQPQMPALLRFYDVGWSTTPVTEGDPVSVQFTVKNEGGVRSVMLDAIWRADAARPETELRVPIRALEPGEKTRPLAFEAISFRTAGSHTSEIRLADGSDRREVTLHVDARPLPRLGLGARYSRGEVGGTDPGTVVPAEREPTCPQSHVATGIRIRSGGSIDRLGLVCGELLPDGSLGVQSPTSMYGGNGGNERDVPCPPGYYLIGLKGKYGRWLDALGVVCASPGLPVEPGQPGWYEDAQLAGNSGGGHEAFRVHCNEGGTAGAVTSLGGRYGSFVNRFELHCTAVVRQ